MEWFGLEAYLRDLHAAMVEGDKQKENRILRDLGKLGMDAFTAKLLVQELEYDK